MAETDVRPYLMERVTAYIRRFLRSLGIRAPLSVAEIKTMIVDSAKQLRRSSGNQSVNGALSAAESLRVAEARSGLLQEAQPVRHAQTFDQARGEAKQFQGKALVNRQMGMSAIVSRNSLDKMLSAKAVAKSESPAAHALAVANLDDLFARALHGWSKPDDKSDPNIVAIHRFFAPIMHNGKAVIAKMTVKETAQTNRPNHLYTVEARSEEQTSEHQ